MLNKELQSKGGKTPRRIYRYSLQDIAAVTGRSIHAIRKDVQRKKLVPGDLDNVVGYVAPYVGWRRDPATMTPEIKHTIEELLEALKKAK